MNATAVAALAALFVLAGCTSEQARPPDRNGSSSEGEHGMGQGPIRLSLYPEGNPAQAWQFCLCGELDLPAPEAEITVKSSQMGAPPEAASWNRTVSYPDQPAEVGEWFDVRSQEQKGSLVLKFHAERPEMYTLHHQYELEVEPTGRGRFLVTVWDPSREFDSSPMSYSLS